jgi:hypothetical protein
MKGFFFILIIVCATSSCQQSKQNALQQKVDSLEKKLANTYKPGFGEFMSSIQVHHAKLGLPARIKTGSWQTLKCTR